MTQTHMKREIAQIPSAVARLLGEGRGAIRAAAKAFEKTDPELIVTIARGASDKHVQ